MSRTVAVQCSKCSGAVSVCRILWEHREGASNLAGDGDSRQIWTACCRSWRYEMSCTESEE